MNRATMRARFVAVIMLVAGSALWADHPDLKVSLERAEHDGVIVEHARYPVPPYSAKWTQWGQGLVASTGKVYSAVGDHKGEGGNTFLYEYDPNTKLLRVVADLQQAVAVADGEYGFGKIHGRISEGRDGKLYFTSFYGVEGPGHLDAAHYLFRYDPTSGKVEAVNKVDRYGLPSSHMWPDGMLMYVEATDKLQLEARFLVFDVQTGRLRFNCAHPEFWSRDLFVDSHGNAYFNDPNGFLVKYDCASNTVAVMPYRMPDLELRRTAGPGPDGFLYGVTRRQHILFRFDPSSGLIIELCRLEGDTGGLALDPTGRYVYYVASEGDSGLAFLTQVDVSDIAKPTKRRFCDLGTVLRQEGSGSGKSYFLDVSGTGEAVYFGLNQSNGVGFFVVHIPRDGRTVFASVHELNTAHQRHSSPTSSRTEEPQVVALSEHTEAVPASAGAAFQTLAAKLKDKEEFAPYLERLALVGEVAAEASRNLRILRQVVLEELLAEGCGQPAMTSPTEPAKSIFSSYELKFAAALPAASQDPNDLALMKEYYNVVYRSAQEGLTQQAGEVAAVDKSRLAEIVGYCLLLPLLHTADEEWSQQTTEQLPAWCRSPETLRAAEQFALDCGRLNTGWCLFRARAEASGARAEEGLPTYLMRVAQDLSAVEKYSDAATVLHRALDVADAGDLRARADIRYQLIGVYRQANQPRLAAGEMELFLRECPDSSEWGKVATERLASLYQAGALNGLADEADALLKDSRCQAYRPQIMYVAWVSCRRLGQQDRAHLLQDSLLKQYPSHPLCADVHFVAAMEALAAGDYTQASAHLETIETQFPNAKVAMKASEIRKKLRAAPGESPR